jgi:hypothetical protein
MTTRFSCWRLLRPSSFMNPEPLGAGAAEERPPIAGLQHGMGALGSRPCLMSPKWPHGDEIS